MSYEHIPGYEDNRYEHDIDSLVKTAIEVLPPEETEVDPYVSGHENRPTQLESPGILYKGDGRIEFSQSSEVRRLMQGNFEIIFAHHQNGTCDLFIHQFKETGGLATRTTFDNTETGWRKEWTAGAFTPMRNLFNPEASRFNRSLESEEVETLGYIVSKAVSGEDVTSELEEFVRVTDEEQALIDQRRAEVSRSLQEYRRDLQKVEEAKRRAWQNSRDIFIR